MKAINKYFMVAIAAFALVSCAKVDPYSPGKPAGSQDYYFADYDAVQVLELTATTIDVIVERADASAAATLPLKTWCSTPSAASFPESVSFASGEKQAKISVTLGEMNPFEEYKLTIALPEEYTQPYKKTESYPICGFTFYKEDFKPYAKGKLYDDFWSGETIESTLEYSVLLDQYRIKGWLGYGTNFKFGWDGAQKFTSVADKQPSGIYHSSYGLISGTLQPAKCKFDAEENALYLGINWTVSAGSFGVYYNVYYIEALAN